MTGCLPIDSFVHTENGLVKIQNIKIGDKVLTSNGYEKVFNVLDRGMNKIVKIYTVDGYFECSENNEMAIYENNKIKWVYAYDIKNREYLISTRVALTGNITQIPFSDKIPIIPELDGDLAWFISVYNRKNIDTFTNLKFAEKIAEQLQRFGYIDTNIEFKNGYYNLIYSNKEHLNLYFNKYFKKGAVIPDFIIKSTLEVRMGYIAGLFDTTDDDDIILSSVCDKSIEYVQNLCYSCGFETRIKSMVNMQTRYYDLVADSCYSYKLIANIPQIIHRFSYDVINYLDNNDKYIPVFIEKIEYQKDEKHCYTISVENMHEFFCNGYLTHNETIIKQLNSIITTASGINTFNELLATYRLYNKWNDIKYTAVILDVNKTENITQTYLKSITETIIIEMNYGFEIQSSVDHKWYVNDTLAKTKEIKSGDCIKIKQGIYINENNNMNPDIGWLLGYYWSDSPRRNCNKLDIIIEENFGTYKNAEDYFNIHYRDKSLIPTIIRENSSDTIIAFMAGMLDASDGVLVLSNKIFAKHLQDVAIAVGIVFDRKYVNDAWLLSIVSCSKNLDTFIKFSESYNDTMLINAELLLGEVINVYNIIGKIDVPDIEIDNSEWYYLGAFKSYNNNNKTI